MQIRILSAGFVEKLCGRGLLRQHNNLYICPRFKFGNNNLKNMILWYTERGSMGVHGRKAISGISRGCGVILKIRGGRCLAKMLDGTQPHIPRRRRRVCCTAPILPHE